MSVSLSTENIQTTISQLNRDFAGRLNSDGYDPSKLLHIHRRNRAFVWNDDMQNKLLDSILNGYYVPPIICCSRIYDGVERREVMEGGNRITTFRRILDGELKRLPDNVKRPLTDDERRRVEAHPITLVVMRNLSSKQQRIMFRRLNKNVKVSDGQLYAMSEDDSPLIQEALAFLNDDAYPLRARITHHFFDTRNADNAGHCNLANSVAIVSGIAHGPEYITKSYNVQDPKVELQDRIDREKIVRIFGYVLDIFDRADVLAPFPDKRKRRGQWSVGYLLGVMLYDLMTNPEEIPRIKEKWAIYIQFVRTLDGAVDAIKLSGAQNLNQTRYKRLSLKVDIYLRDGRLATDAELNLHTTDGVMDDETSTIDTEYEDDE